MSKPWKPSVRLPADTKGWGGDRKSRAAFEAQLQVDIDWAKLAELLARRCAHSKRGKTGMLNGIVKAKLTGSAPEWVPDPR